MYKTGRNNHDFQIAYFIAGRCHTPDAAYAQLCDLEDDRRRAIEHFHVSEKRSRAKEMRINASMSRNPDDAERLELEAEAEELANGAKEGAWLFKVASEELAFIQKAKDAIAPLRRYKHLPQDEANQAAQRDEWCLELIHRAENYLLSQGHIPHDELATMRAHPDFKEAIMPAIERFHAAKASGEVCISERTWSLPPALLSSPKLVAAE